MEIKSVKQLKEIIEKSPEGLVAIIGNNVIFETKEDIQYCKIDSGIIEKIKQNKMFNISYDNMHTIVKLEK